MSAHFPLKSPAEFPGAVWSRAAGCHAVVISPLGPDDPHAVISILVEDDEVWHEVRHGMEFSSAWLPHLLDSLDRAYLWLRQHADQDQYGFTLIKVTP